MFTDFRASAPLTRDTARRFPVPVDDATDLPAFIRDLRIVSRDLEYNIEEPRPEALALFKGYTPQHFKHLYPVCSNRTAWRGHRCGVTQDELEQAGFRDYAKLFSFGRDPYRFLKLGEVPLGTIWWRHGPFYDKHDETFRPQLRRPRALFFKSLADVLAVRS
jgi:hypothetical protein